MQTTSALIAALSCLALGGCATSRRDAPPAAATAAAPARGGPDWNEIDKTVQRVRAREQSKLHAVETNRAVESGFFRMTDEEYAAALEAARTHVRKAKPKISDVDLEAEAVRIADEARQRHEQAFTQRATSTYELERQ